MHVQATEKMTISTRTPLRFYVVLISLPQVTGGYHDKTGQTRQPLAYFLPSPFLTQHNNELRIRRWRLPRRVEAREQGSQRLRRVSQGVQGHIRRVGAAAEHFEF